jgi:uncharacterized cupin superfamily protein
MEVREWVFELISELSEKIESGVWLRTRGGWRNRSEDAELNDILFDAVIVGHLQHQ